MIVKPEHIKNKGFTFLSTTSVFLIYKSFDKEDMDTAVGWVNSVLPEEKPRHLLGIGEPEDLFGGIQNGVDLFDCVAPTRNARNGTLYTSKGKINILNAKFTGDPYALYLKYREENPSPYLFLFRFWRIPISRSFTRDDG